MMRRHSAPDPMEELARLRELEAYEILDTPSEPVFDELAALSARLCETPIALITLVDKNRQWFKARHGMSERETARSDAFCAHTVLEDTPMVVRDALRDSRFRSNRLVTGKPHIRFYAGAPLRTPAGHRLGSLCVIDRKARRMPRAQLRDLKTLARAVVNEMESRRVRRLAERFPERAQLLSGVIAICSCCSKVRDRRGEWNTLGRYLDRLAGVTVAHTFCRQCELREPDA